MFQLSVCKSLKTSESIIKFQPSLKEQGKSLRFYKFNGKCWMSLEKTLRDSNYHSHCGKLNCDLILNVFQEKEKRWTSSRDSSKWAPDIVVT